jgi:TonB family protein
MRANLILICVIGLVVVSCAYTRIKNESGSPLLPPETFVNPHDTPPEFVLEVDPEYPRLARVGGFSAIVEIRAFVDSTGTVIKAEARSTNPRMGFEEAGVKAAYNSEFAPATWKGKPIGVWIRYKYRFDLELGIEREAIDSHDLAWSIESYLGRHDTLWDYEVHALFRQVLCPPCSAAGG